MAHPCWKYMGWGLAGKNSVNICRANQFHLTTAEVVLKSR